ncbi:hypothetical protein Vadar_016352 [Vaccinium darrowii]|uniref:Uncharacterized protein n=1 Tax=Vaccinium darrowii TaxID=229202 RepID=A0ACB7XZR4_9ERIC|nr:hypothetical protein Vadar_016352 [Vaccinium darrowii]
MEKGWVPNFSTMKSLVNGLASVLKVDEARELVEQMKEKFSKSAYMWSQVEEILHFRVRVWGVNNRDERRKQLEKGKGRGSGIYGLNVGHVDDSLSKSMVSSIKSSSSCSKSTAS